MTETNAQTYTLTPSVYSHGGEVFDRLPDGRVVFVPFAIPGETILVQLVEDKRGYARAELLEVISPAPERVQPRCIHFASCGGCHYQHMPYTAQLEAKKAVLSDQLERIGKLENPPVIETIPAPNESLYRNHVQFHLTATGKLGYYKHRSDEVFAIQECHLPEEALNRIWPQLDFESDLDLERIGLRLGAGDDIQMILESSDLKAPGISVEDLPASVVHLSPAGSLVLAGGEYTVIEVLGRPFQVSAGSFFQVNTAMAVKLVEHLLGEIPRFQALSPDTTLIDVYCGVGPFSAFLAPQVGRLVGIEASPSACADFEVNLDEFDHVELYESGAKAALKQFEFSPDIILVDPPRAGVDRHAMDELLRLSAPLLVYISCDPATLGRDARRLTAGGYRLEQVTPFDLFPQTYHIESISFWVKDA